MTPRPQVWLVSPAWQRFDVTRLVLKQREHLAASAAARGIDVHTVIVADDHNVDIAHEHGAHVVEMDNDQGVGRRFNAGFQYAARQGADWLVHIGSDDWLHPDALTPILEPEDPGAIISGRQLAFVDLRAGRMQTCTLRNRTGVVAWLIPRAVMAPCGFAPIPGEKCRGLDGHLVNGLTRSGVRVRWTFHDPSPVARIDFKSAVNLNPYEHLSKHLADSPEITDPWPVLAEHYPSELVEAARATSLKIAGEPRMPRLTHPVTGEQVRATVAGAAILRARGYRDERELERVTPPQPTATAPRPARSAPRAAWEAYAAAHGIEDPAALSKADLIDLLT